MKTSSKFVSVISSVLFLLLVSPLAASARPGDDNKQNTTGVEVDLQRQIPDVFGTIDSKSLTLDEAESRVLVNHSSTYPSCNVSQMFPKRIGYDGNASLPFSYRLQERDSSAARCDERRSGDPIALHRIDVDYSARIEGSANFLSVKLQRSIFGAGYGEVAIVNREGKQITTSPYQASISRERSGKFEISVKKKPVVEIPASNANMINELISANCQDEKASCTFDLTGTKSEVGTPRLLDTFVNDSETPASRKTSSTVENEWSNTLKVEAEVGLKIKQVVDIGVKASAEHQWSHSERYSTETAVEVPACNAVKLYLQPTWDVALGDVVVITPEKIFKVTGGQYQFPSKGSAVFLVEDSSLVPAQGHCLQRGAK